MPTPATHPAPAPGPVAFERLLIVRLGAMGDILHSMPAVTAVRQAHPEWTIGWAIEPHIGLGDRGAKFEDIVWLSTSGREIV